VIRDGLASLVEQLDAVLDEQAPKIVRITEQIISKKGRALAHLVKSEDKITIFPINVLRIRAEDPAITSFLVPSILDKMKEKGVEYNINSNDVLLTKITVMGIQEDKLRRFKGAVRWAFEKASERPWSP